MRKILLYLGTRLAMVSLSLLKNVQADTEIIQTLLEQWITSLSQSQINNSQVSNCWERCQVRHLECASE